MLAKSAPRVPVALFLIAITAAIITGLLATFLANRAVDAEATLIVIASTSLITSAFTTLGRAAWIGVVLGLYIVFHQVLGRTLAEPGLMVYGGAALAFVLFWAATVGKRRLGVGDVARDPLFLLGVAPWLLGIIGPLAVGNATVAAQRLVLGSVLWAIYLALRKHRDPVKVAWGMVLGQSMALVAVSACGLLQPLSVSDQATLFTVTRTGAFGGGDCAVLHPNLIGIFSFTLFVAWLALRGSHPLARLVGLLGPSLLLLETASRTAVAATLIGAAVWAGAGARTRSSVLPDTTRRPRRRTLRTVLIVGLVLCSGVFVGQEFFQQERSRGVGALTGRDLIWAESLAEIQSGGRLQLLLGQVERANLEVQLPGTLTTWRGHNAAIDIMGRAGAIGLIVAMLGLLLLLRRYARMIARSDWAFSSAIVLGAVATAPTESFLIGSLFPWIVLADVTARKQAASEQRRPVVLRNGDRVNDGPRALESSQEARTR